jgi:hypothetical protein
MVLQNNETSVWEDYLAQGGNKRGTMRAQLIPKSCEIARGKRLKYIEI